jgi:hypothetical protein
VFGGDTLRFTIRNHSTNAISLTSLTADHNVSGYYERIQVGGTTVFNYANPPYNGTRAASGQTVTFSTSVNINGSGNPAQTVPVRVQKATTITPDVFIDDTGPAVVIQLIDFRSTQTGAGSSVNPSGGAFTVTFSDGSQATFTVP